MRVDGGRNVNFAVAEEIPIRYLIPDRRIIPTMAYVVWRVLVKQYSKVRLGVQRNSALDEDVSSEMTVEQNWYIL